MSEVLSELPDGWEAIPLGEIVKLEYGKSLTVKDRDESGEVPVYGSSGDVGRHNEPYVKAPCLIVGRKGNVGSVFISHQPCWPIDTVYYVMPPEGLDIKYLYYQLGHLNLAHLDKSTAIPGLNRNDAYKVTFKLAPPGQQKRIVAKIEELFSHIDAGIEALKKAKQLLKQYRQSVLKAAVTGELTKEWRDANKGKLEPASQLLERILKERRQKWEEQQLEQFKAKAKMPKDDKWKLKYEDPSIEDCFTDLVDESWLKANMEILKYYSIYGPRFSSKDYSEDGVVVLRTTDINEYGKVKIKDAPKLDLHDSEYEKYKVELGDLLITRTGSIGTLAIFNDACRAIPGAYLLHYKFTQGVAIPEYIYLVFKSPNIQKILTSSTVGIGRPNLNAPTFEAIKFNLPSVDEQHEIVSVAARKFEAINRLEAEIDNKTMKAEKNKQTTLAAAFSGKITR